MPFDRGDPVNFKSVFLGQLLRNIGQCLELLEVGVLGDQQVFVVI